MADPITEQQSVAGEKPQQPDNTINVQLDKELSVGIAAFVSPNLPGFTGVLKKRYTDFLVNEILPSGEVIHLTELKDPRAVDKRKPQSQAEAEKPKPSTSQADTTNESGATSVPEDQTKVPTDDKPAPPANDEFHRGETNPKAEGVVHDAEPDAESAEATQKEPLSEEKAPYHNQIQSTQASENQNGDGVGGWRDFADKGDVPQLKPEDESTLKTYFDETVVTQLLALFNRILSSPHRKIKEYGTVTSGKITDRGQRTKIHQNIRRIFSGRLESYTDSEGSITVSAACTENTWAGQASSKEGGKGRGGGRRGRGGHSGGPHLSVKERFKELGGDYLHFSLYKENKDTMEVVSFLARQLHVRPQGFQFAGTKDRRGITVQRVSVYRIFADRMVNVGKILRNAQVGNYEYHTRGLELGELTGNEFVITLRDCQFSAISDGPIESRAQQANDIVQESLKQLAIRGFINYYGLQRFGTYATRTDAIGTALLKGDFATAANSILDFSPSLLDDLASAPTDRMSSEDRARAQAIHSFRETGKIKPALDTLPKKFTAEAALIRHLGSPNNANDYLTALQSIPRNLRLMYVHAYQSLIWNLAATHRWNMHGDKVVEGDLVLVNEHVDAVPAEDTEEVDADGEPIVRPAGDDRANSLDDLFERARALTAEEAASGKYNIFDIVLPTPGYDILYPSFMEPFYKETMGKEEYGCLDPHDMRRSVKDLSLSGSYRKVLARPGEYWSASVKVYEKEDEKFVETDGDRLEARKVEERLEKRKKFLKESGNDDDAGGEVTAGGVVTEASGAEPLSIPTEAVKAAEPAVVAESEAAPEPEEPKPDKLAVVLKLQLGSSTYATMALRELMKEGGVQTYKPDYGVPR